MFGLFPQSDAMNDQEPLVTGISSAFLARHSQDGGLLESLQASAGASYMASVISFFQLNRAMPYVFCRNNIDIWRQRNSYYGVQKLLNRSECLSPRGRGRGGGGLC